VVRCEIEITDLALVIIASTTSYRAYTEGVKSADRTALLTNQNPDLILAILNMLMVRSPISS